MAPIPSIRRPRFAVPDIDPFPYPGRGGGSVDVSSSETHMVFAKSSRRMPLLIAGGNGLFRPPAMLSYERLQVPNLGSSLSVFA